MTPRRPEAGSFGAALALIAGLAGCVQAPPPRSAQVLPPPALTAPYAAAATVGTTVYRLDPAASQVLILVGKTGALSAFGHRHVIRVGALRGFALTRKNGEVRGDLIFPERALEVDPPAVRRALGPPYSDHQPDADARRGTRKNMLGGHGLDAARYPRLRLRITATALPPQGKTRITVAIMLHGVTRTIAMPTHYTRSPANLQVEGRFTIRQTDFGIAPYSALLGALRVEDKLEIRYHLDFERWCASAENRSCSTLP